MKVQYLTPEILHGVIHMNGRIYDPTLGRMLQADPFIQAPGNTQSYNRYSYVMNNPLGYTDPSGFIFKELANIAAAAVGFYVCGPACAGAAVTATNLAQGVELKYALINGVSTAAFASIASPGFADTAFAQAVGVEVGRAAAFGAVGGIATSLQGGNFGHGFLIAGVSGAIGQTAFMGGTGGPPVDIAIRSVAKAIVGGTVSHLSGGKFANGAATVTFVSIVTEGAVAASRSNSFDPIRPDIATPDVETAQIALNVDAELIDSPYAVKSPGNLPAYSRSGIIEEVVVRAQYTGAKLPPLTPASGIMFYGAAYRSIDPIGNQAARVLGWQLKVIACVSFMTACSAYGAAETTANFVQNPNPMDATSLGYELYKARFGGSHPVNQAVDMAIGEFLGALPRQ